MVHGYFSELGRAVWTWGWRECEIVCCVYPSGCFGMVWESLVRRSGDVVFCQGSWQVQVSGC